MYIYIYIYIYIYTRNKCENNTANDTIRNSNNNISDYGDEVIVVLKLNSFF